ncbi:TonB-dependent receptor [Parapedobacter koreensis]|nr:TonB-dependent receptor [Parapedobacter koreensis]
MTKLTALLLVLGCMHLNARSLSQTITFKAKNQSLITVFEFIEAQTGYQVVYNERFIKTAKPVTINANRMSLADFLKAVLTPQSLTYQIEENTVLISRIPQPVSRVQAPPLLIQQREISGRVTDEQGNVLQGVTISVKGTAAATTSNENGDYRLAIPDDANTLVFSIVGFEPQEHPIGTSTTVNITLIGSISDLEEVVVVGYGTVKKETLTGSISTVKGSEILQAPVTNVSNSLSGRLPGLVAVSPSGEPGNDASILRIRGVNSLGDNNPLVVVDGVPDRSLDRIDPASIESITVLKDAAAAIYGARAANGVILITTKRGSTGKPTITANFNQGFAQPTRIPEMANAQEYATLLNEINLYAGFAPLYSEEELAKFADGSDPWRYPNTDWFDVAFRPWASQNYGNLSVSGGSEAIKYFMTVGVNSQDGYFKNSSHKYQQYSFRSNVDGKINEYISLGFDIAGRMEDRNYPTRPNNDLFGAVIMGKPTMVAYWPNGLIGPAISDGDNAAIIGTDATGYDRSKWYILNTNAKLNITIPWVEGLSVNSNLAIDKGFNFQKRFEKPWYLNIWDGQTVGDDGLPVLVNSKRGYADPRLTERMEDNQNILINAMVNYQTMLFTDHSLKILVGIESITGKGDRFNAFRRGFISTSLDQLDAAPDLEQSNGGSAFVSARQNYFGRVNYTIADKYLAEFVWRYDGSYIFPENKRYGFFPGISLGYIISQEGFWKDNIPYINHFKIRASSGKTGNDRIDEFQYLATFGIRGERFITNRNVELLSLYESQIPNTNVTWEVANQSNIGIDAGLANGKISITADYFNYRRSNILWWRNASVPQTTGLTLPRENIGKVRNRGFDFSVTYDDKAGDFSYQVGINGGYQKNEITYWDESPGAPEYQRSTGRPIPSDPLNADNDLYYQAIGVFRDQAEIDATPHWGGARPGDIIFADVNEDGKIDALDKVRNDKTNLPRLTGGLSIGLQYKGFDFSLLVQGAAGGVLYSQTTSGEVGNYLKDFYENRWTPENPDASYPRTFNWNQEYWRNQRNTFWLQKTDYIRLKNIEVGYSLPTALSAKFGVQNLRINVNGYNLFTYSPGLKDFDPELGVGTGRSYLVQKIVNAGLSVTF